MEVTRRYFAKQALLAGGSLALGCATHVSPTSAPLAPTAAAALALPEPDSSGIDHIVVVTMENRSFDHFLGWLPNAAGQQAGLTYTDRSGAAHATHSLSGDFTGCPQADPDHSYHESRVAYDDGRMDGFLRAGSNDLYTVGYYEEKDMPFFAALARNYTTCDRYFASILGPTFPNRIFQYAAQTDRTENSVAISTLPTIFDTLAAAKVSHGYYYGNAPFLTLWGPQYLGISLRHADFLSQAAAGALPAVSFIDPRYTIVDDGTGNDDHPHADIRRGDRFLYDLFEAVASGPAWSGTVFIINFDEWGGFFDHVAPPRVIAGNTVDADMVAGKALLGFRLPVVVASAFTRGDGQSPRISSLLFDHTSVLKLIQWRWSLPPLSPRDAGAEIANLAYALNFNQPNAAVPALPKPSVPSVAVPCFGSLGGSYRAAQATGSTAPATPWGDLQRQAAQYGFPLA